MSSRSRRTLSGRASLLVWLGLGLLVWLDQVHPVVTVPVTAAWIGVVISAIAQVFGYIGAHVVTVVVTIAQAAVMIGTAIAHFALQLGAVFGKVYQLLTRFYQGALRPFVGWSWRQVDRLSAWLQRYGGRVIKFLEEVRKQVGKFYDKWFRPIFDAIDMTRRILQILAQLHIPWARELDAQLAKLEARLLWPIQQLYRRLNEVIGWVNRIITLDGYLQRITLIRSLWRHQEDALKVWWNSIHKPPTKDQEDEYQKALKPYAIAARVDESRVYAETGDGPNAGRIAEHVRDLQLRVARP